MRVHEGGGPTSLHKFVDNWSKFVDNLLEILVFFSVLNVEIGRIEMCSKSIVNFLKLEETGRHLIEM